MNSKLTGKRILILGAGTWLVPHIIKAKRLGLITYVTDWFEEAEGKKYADFFEAIDLKDKEATLKYAIDNKIEAVYTSADIGVPTAAYVANKMGLKYHSESLAHCATNKAAMREKAKEFGLPIPEFFKTNTLESACSAASRIGYPVIIKPVDNFSSRGVSVLHNESDLKNAFQESLNSSFIGDVLIEELMTGVEGSVEALIQKGEVYIMGVCDKEKSELPFRYDLQLNYPGNYTTDQMTLIEAFINSLVKGFGIKDGIIHVEIMVSNEVVKLIEFGVRGCGSKVTTHLLPEMLDYDVLSFLLHNSFDIEQTIDFSPSQQGVLKFIMLPKGKIKEIKGVENVKGIEGIVDFDIERKPGDIVEQIKDGRTRPCYLLAVAKNKNELNKVIEKATSAFSVSYQ